MPRWIDSREMLRVDVGKLAAPIAWLSDHGVSSAQLADVFGTSEANIRQLRWRANHRRGGPQGIAPLGPPPSLSKSPTPAERQALGVQVDPDDLVLSDQEGLTLDDLEERVEAVARVSAQQYRYRDARAALRALAPAVGWPARARRVRLLARLHQHLAWFALHRGLARTALRDSRHAMALSRVAYHDSDDVTDLRRLAESALIASQAHLLWHEPHAALCLLEVKRHVSAHGRLPVGSDYFRQLGVVAFQLGPDADTDRRAREYFGRAVSVQEYLGEFSHPLQLQMTGARHAVLLESVPWDRAWELVDQARVVFGEGSLEWCMATHWAVAAARICDSPAIEQAAEALLAANAQAGRGFGHQATIHHLLALTPALHLPQPLLPSWVRRLLYANAFRSR